MKYDIYLELKSKMEESFDHRGAIKKLADFLKHFIDKPGCIKEAVNTGTKFIVKFKVGTIEGEAICSNDENVSLYVDISDENSLFKYRNGSYRIITTIKDEPKTDFDPKVGIYEEVGSFDTIYKKVVSKIMYYDSETIDYATSKNILDDYINGFIERISLFDKEGLVGDYETTIRSAVLEEEVIPYIAKRFLEKNETIKNINKEITSKSL